MSKIKQTAEELAQPIAAQLGLYLYDVEYKKEGSDWRLIYYIDKEDGVSLSDCEEFSRAVSDVLDAADPIEQNYILTVSSPGIERKLSKPAHYIAVIGKEIELRLFAPVNGEKRITGILKSFEEPFVELESDGSCVKIDLKDISAAKLIYHF